MSRSKFSEHEKQELGSGLQYCNLAFCKTVIGIFEDLIAVDIGILLPETR